ncbi:MAG: hypothetical protein JSR77_04390 [Planctomycetes bacterium]|nr:hypothetical protein [Planctomycetota bacterium]
MLLHSMLRTRFHHLFSLLCLAAVVLGQSVASHFMVRCEDSAGTRLELACERSGEGACLGGGAADDAALEHGATDERGPCKDTPLSATHDAAKVLATARGAELAMPVCDVALVLPRIDWIETPMPRRSREVVALTRPRDTAERMRTIILQV